jgi:putative ABC transport system permease protein
MGPGGARLAQGSRWSLNDGDVEAIRNEVPEVQYATGSLRGSTQVVYAENNASTQWQGVQPDWFEINDWQIAQGDGFEVGDYGGGAKPVILGDTVRKSLFGDDDGIGQTVRLGRVPFTVVGTLKPKGQGGFGQDQDDIVVVPLEVARRRLSNSQSMPPGAVQQISVGVDSANNLDSAQSQIESLLRQRHRIEPGADDDFAVRNISQIVATRTATTNLMS